MPSEDQVKQMLESFDEAFADLDEQQRRLDSYRLVRKKDTEFQVSVMRRQDELDHVRSELLQRYNHLHRITGNRFRKGVEL